MSETRRALALVATATAVAALVLGIGFDGAGPGPSEDAAPPTATPTPVPTVDPNATPEPTPTPTPVPTPTPDPDRVEPSTVRVAVANATDIVGLAATAADTLVATYGYNAVPTNAEVELNTVTSVVWFRDGFEANSREIAVLLEIDDIAPMPEDPPVGAAADSDIVVLLGLRPLIEEEPTPSEG